MRGNDLATFLDGLVRRIAQYVEESHIAGNKTVDYLPAVSRNAVTDLSLPLEGHGTQAILDDIDEFLKQCVKTNRPEFMNPLWGGINLAGFAGEVIAALTNQNGNVLAMMPHPERAFYHYHIPNWQSKTLNKFADGYKIFMNAKKFFE